MTVRIAQFAHPANDVVDEAFLRDVPEIEAAKADSIESLSDALDGVEIFHVYSSAFIPEFARLVRDKGRSLKWIQLTNVGIDVALKVGLPEGIWITNSGDISQRVLAGHAIALMLGVMRNLHRFDTMRAQRRWARQDIRHGGGLRHSLACALAEGRIIGAGLDAFAEEPLPAVSLPWDLPNVLMTPHVGGQGGPELWRRMSELIRDNTRRYLSGAPLQHVVRTPDGSLQGFGNP